MDDMDEKKKERAERVDLEPLRLQLEAHTGCQLSMIQHDEGWHLYIGAVPGNLRLLSGPWKRPEMVAFATGMLLGCYGGWNE